MKDDIQHLSTSSFPPLLSEISDPPKRISVRGKLPSFEYKWLAVVGSRAVSAYGKQVVNHLIEGLRGYPIVIVSGLAYGVDALAHKAALQNSLTTIAVPGSGLDYSVLYPRANVSLAREIIEKGGAHLSEFEPTQKATDYTFPQRNRIMAGMCHATLIVEAQERSGSLITARLATEYNRDLLVVPGSIFSDTSKGTHQFLKLGATPITEPADILRALDIREEKRTMTRTDVSPEEQRVFAILKTPLSREALLESLKLPISESHVLISTMEIKELIVEEMGLMRIR
jgi:DNA processing protein